MTAAVVGRDAELGAIDRLLDALPERPATLVLEGEPGIGKTTLMRTAVDSAHRRGVRVFSCTGSPSHVRLSYSGLAELFTEVDDDALSELTPPQREALDTVLLRSSLGADAIDPLAVSTATLSVLERLASEGPVLIALDDLQWLDRSTARVVQYCSRRLIAPSRQSAAPVGLIITRRVGAEPGRYERAAAVRPDDWTEVIRVGSLGAQEIAGLIKEQVPRQFDRRELVRVWEASGGNPFYALELSRVLPEDATKAASLPLPETLEGVVSARTTGLGEEMEDTLLAVAAMANPTVDLIEQLAGHEAVLLLEGAEERGLLKRDGRRLHFTHPLLAHGIYESASAPRRREMHRRIAEVATDPEERARHLAYGEVLPDAIEALDEASRYVRERGAPLVAADLLELALELGGDSALRVRLAEHMFDLGEPQRAEQLVKQALEEGISGDSLAEALLLLGEIAYADNRYPEARDALERGLQVPGAQERLLALMEFQLTLTRFNLGLWDDASAMAHAALSRAERLQDEGLLAVAHAAVALTDFLCGRGLDEGRLEKARSLEDPQWPTSAAFSPESCAAILYFWVGRLDDGRRCLDVAYERWCEQGQEPATALAASMRVWLECSSGDLDAAAPAAAEAQERLRELGIPSAEAQALWAGAHVAAYAGRVEEARRDARKAMEQFLALGWHNRTTWPLGTLGFLELSVGDYEAAADTLGAAAARIVDAAPEPVVLGMFLTTDAAEGLIGAGRVEEAEPIVAAVERHGEAQDRAWALAMGARCRGLILAANGDVDAAEDSLERALAVHDRLPIPVERARTLLVLGRIRRRLRKRRAAKEALDEALSTFEAVGSPRWADQARAEIDAIGLRLGAGDELTPAEKRVAALAAQGLSNKEIASTLVVSAKTVEAHLGRTYRKLNVRSRTELAAKLADSVRV